MAIMASAKGGDYTPPDENIYNAVCIGVYDLGMQNTNYGIQHQVYINWEIDCKRQDGKSFTVGTKLSPSLHKKANFRKLLEGWRGQRFTEEQAKQGFDCMKLLGKGCQLQVLHKTAADGRVFANVNTVIKLGNGMAPLVPTIKPTSYSLDDDGFTIPPDVPEWIVKQIQGSLEWTRGKNAPNPQPSQQQSRNNGSIVETPALAAQRARAEAEDAIEPTYAPDGDPNEVPFSWLIGFILTALTVGGVV